MKIADLAVLFGFRRLALLVGWRQERSLSLQVVRGGGDSHRRRFNYWCDRFTTRARESPLLFFSFYHPAAPLCATFCGNVDKLLKGASPSYHSSNLSEEHANAFFADGIQDEILSDLAKIADLKVISRTSVQQYRANTPRAQCSRNCATNRGGSIDVLEGSVQRTGNKVRVTGSANRRAQRCACLGRTLRWRPQ